MILTRTNRQYTCVAAPRRRTELPKHGPAVDTLAGRMLTTRNFYSHVRCEGIVAKNKGKFGKGKPKVEETDEFISATTRLAERLKPHAFGLIAAAAVATVLTLAIIGYRWYQNKKLEDATTAFAEVTKVIAQPTPDEAFEPKDAKFKTEAERDQAIVAALDNVVSGHSGVSPGKQAWLLQGAAYARLGKYDQAIAAYQKYSGPEVLERHAREGMALAMEERAGASEDAAAREQGLKDALSAFAAVQPRDDGPGRDLALYHQGRVHATLQQVEEARKKFQEVVDFDPPSPLKGKAEVRLILLSVAAPVKQGAASDSAGAAGTAENKGGAAPKGATPDGPSESE